jgi:hypothetical protein
MQVPEAASGSTTAAASVGSGELWVLYEDATVAIVQVQELLLRIRAAVYGTVPFGFMVLRRCWSINLNHRLVFVIRSGPSEQISQVCVARSK